jgi:hypothetical protein
MTIDLEQTREREADPEDMMDTDEWRAYTTEEEGK